MSINTILTHRAQNNWRGVLDEWNKLDDVEKSTHIMTDSDVYKSVQGAKLQEETHQKLIDSANAQQGKPYVPENNMVATHMLMRYYKDPKNEPGVIATNAKTFHANNEEDLRHAVQRYARKNGILQMASLTPEQMEKYNESNTQIQST